MKYSLLFILISICLLLTIGCERQGGVNPSGKTIKIGVIGPFSGPDEVSGEDGVRGMRSVMHMHPYLNNGDALELVIIDDKNDPVAAQNGLKNLIMEKKVSAILLLSINESARAVTELADEYGVPIVIVLASDAEIAAEKTYVSQLNVGNILQGSVTALFVRDELLIDKVAVIFDPSSVHFMSLATEFSRKFKEIGGTIITETAMTSDTDELNTVLTTLQQKGTQFLYLPVDVPDFTTLSKTINDMRWAPERMCSIGLFSDLLRQSPKEADLLNEIYDIDFYGSDIGLTSFGEQAVKVHEKLFGQVGSNSTALGAEGYAILRNAMNQCENPAEHQCVNTMLRKTKGFEGLVGRITIHANGEVERPLIINRVIKGRESFQVKVY